MFEGLFRPGEQYGWMYCAACQHTCGFVATDPGDPATYNPEAVVCGQCGRGWAVALRPDLHYEPLGAMPGNLGYGTSDETNTVPRWLVVLLLTRPDRAGAGSIDGLRPAAPRARPRPASSPKNRAASPPAKAPPKKGKKVP